MYMKYGQTIAVSNSLRKHVGVSPFHESDPVVDAWLDAHGFRCVIAILVDALGTSIIQKHLPEDSFLRRYTAEDIATVFPPTTAAATTAFLTGKYPMETGWLGWQEYFREVDDEVILFYDRSMYGDGKYPGLVRSALPIHWLCEEEGCDSVWPFWSHHHPSATFAQLVNNVRLLSLDPDKKFIYGYWDALDSLMHKAGTGGEGVLEMVTDINYWLEWLANHLPGDAGLLVIADHSQVDVTLHKLSRPVCSCLKRPPVLEMRTTGYYIKNGMEEKFENLFNAQYSQWYDLYTRQKVLDSHMFGEGEASGRFMEELGDYIAVAKGTDSLFYGKSAVKGDHAGGMEEEAIVPVVLYPG